MAPNIAGGASCWWGVLAIWCVGGLLSLCGASVYAELATAYPRAGGDYVYLTRAYGRWAGFLFGWMQLAVVRPGDIAVMAFIFATYAQTIYNPAAGAAGAIEPRLWACGAVVALTIINMIGVQQGKWTQNFLTVVKALGLTAIIGVAFLAPHERSSIVLSELSTAAPVSVEFQNASGEDLDVSGWQVFACGVEGREQPQLIFTLPKQTVCPAGGMFVVGTQGDAPGTYPTFQTGSAVRWSSDESAGVLLADADGQVVDFLAIGKLDSAQIETPAAVVPEQWQGEPVVVPSEDAPSDDGSEKALSYQRGGGVDYDRAADWSLGDASPGNANSWTPPLAVALILVLFTFGGWNEMAYVAAEVKNPRRNIVRALVLGTVTVTVLYLLVNAAFLYTLGYHGLANSGAVANDAVSTVFPKVGGRLIAALVCISALGTVNGLVFTGARISYAVGADHRAFRVLGQWNAEQGTPIRALLLQGALAVTLILALGHFLETVIYTAAAVYLFYVGTCLALIVLRYKDPQIERPYRVTGYPFTPLFFSAVCGWLIYRAILYKPEISMIALGIVAIGLPLYWLTNRREPVDDQESTPGA